MAIVSSFAKTVSTYDNTRGTRGNCIFEISRSVTKQETGYLEGSKKLDEAYYVLGWPQASGKVAVLCRSRGNNPGPAYCWTKREAIQLRTKLANDKRGESNPNARRIIRQLLVYRYMQRNPLPWRDGDLWVYTEQHYLEPMEALSVKF